MNIIFLTLLDFKSYSDHNIYCDLLREFIKNEHNVYCISPSEKRNGEPTHFEENGKLLKLKIGNTQKTNIIEKGFSTLMIEPQFVNAIKKYFKDVKFDLVLYSTPPITLAGAVNFIKKRDNAITYLMLKDIFPQNAVDIGMLSKTGVKSILYRYFRNKEKKLYKISDCIGCMSPANMDFVLNHNLYISKEKVTLCPNCIEIQDLRLKSVEKKEIRQKYKIPLDKVVFVYGGNLGKPQGIPYIIDCLKTQKDNQRVYFLIVGDGTEFESLNSYVRQTEQKNVKLLQRLPKDDFDRLVASSDVGLIFLDYRFTIPNFPSRLLSYMQAGLPILACTDSNTDIRDVIVRGNFGWWCESKDSQVFSDYVDIIAHEDLTKYRENSYDYLATNFSSNHVYKEMEKTIR